MCDVNDMLAEIASARESQSKQINDLNYIIEKSNAVLLELDSDHASDYATSSPILYAYSTETFQTMAKVIQRFYEFQSYAQLEMETKANSVTFEDYLTENVQSLKFLGNSVRKLLAINDIVSQMKYSLLEQQSMENEDSQDDEFSNSD